MAGIVTTSSNSTVSNYDTKTNYQGPLAIVTSLFFMWGFITCLNDLLIPKLKEVFTLQNWQAMLIQTAFFGAYFIISLAYFLFSITKGDPIVKIGYKNGIIIGLVVAALGCALFYPAADYKSYGFFLGALFVLASGITILQIAANPYVAILGSPESSSSRLNMTQAFNSLGTTVAPVLGGFLIFQAATEVVSTPHAESVKLPYLGLAAALLLIALFIKLARLPQISGEAIKVSSNSGALKHRHLVLGVICIFMYVGGEVSIGSSLIGYLRLPKIGGLSELQASQYLAFFWGGAMIGRFIGAVALSEMANLKRYVIIAVITLISVLVVYSLYNIDFALIILGLIVLNVIVFLIGSFIPSRTLGLFATAVIILLGITIAAEGQLALWSVIAIGLFNSIMFPTIFTLAIKGLGADTSQGSSLLVMAIVGGAIIPPLQGVFADATGNLQLSFIVPMLCYAYIVYYGFIGSKPKSELNL